MAYRDSVGSRDSQALYLFGMVVARGRETHALSLPAHTPSHLLILLRYASLVSGVPNASMAEATHRAAREPRCIR